jgi:AcrR family transcriptional regulator
MEKSDTLLKLKEKERETRRELIIEAARAVFGEKTYDRVSMAEIARSAGIAKSSIYTYFNSQEALFVEIAVRDTRRFIENLEKNIVQSDQLALEKVINYFLDYYCEHEAQWRMITHFALYGNKRNESVEKLDLISRQLLDQFAKIFEKLGYNDNTRMLAHTLFSSLSGILIAFRKYPGRTESEKVMHMKRIGRRFEKMFTILREP